MSEEILKALTQLFAIVSKQDDGVTENERNFVIRFFQQELDQASVNGYIEFFDDVSGYKTQDLSDTNKLTSVKDSVKTLGICRKINKTLTQKQKIVVIIRLLELVCSEENFTAQSTDIIKTVADVFKIDVRQYELIESFVITRLFAHQDSPDLRVMDLMARHAQDSGHDHITGDGQLVFLYVSSVDMYFTRYIGKDSNILNGFIMQPNRVYLFSHGSTVKLPSGDAVYYSDLVAHFNKDIQGVKLSFNANVEEFRFSSGAIGLRNVVIAEGPGKLIGIMGASGAGKTTLLNVLAGLEKPSIGEILINGLNIHTEKERVHGVIGYVAQDDLLIEELTVYQNLYYNAKLCFSGFSEEQLKKRVLQVLENLGLEQRKDLKVGSVLDKTISGGQRKRLNIALELIREPAVLFLDEPTSGLSSRDSENVIDLLKELSLKGKLIFVVIHQPSSDIYKMFDKMIIMDTGGYPAYYGIPVEAIRYFKTATHQVDSNKGQCELCANVNPEQIFNIIESKVIDEYGQLTPKRKVTPFQWYDMYRATFRAPHVPVEKEEPPGSLSLPNKLNQMLIYAKRDLTAKLTNHQYLIINLLEAPLLAFILSIIIRYKADNGNGEYSFRYNDNIPAFFLMSVIVALFMGLTVSAEEIIRDRKILRRESFLNLSWTSYLLSKVGILFLLSAVQTLLFVVISDAILGINGITIGFWLVLFTTSCFANVLGLNISSAFNSSVTVYILIPLLLIPQMILSGLLFNYEKLNGFITDKGKVPLLADIMASRWAFEALAVYQFTSNEYEIQFYNYEKEKAQADFKSAYLSTDLKERNNYIRDNYKKSDDRTRDRLNTDFRIIYSSLRNETIGNNPLSGPDPDYNLKTVGAVDAYIDDYKSYYQQRYNKFESLIDKKMRFCEESGWSVADNKNENFNESVSDLVRNTNAKNRLIEYHGNLRQLSDPIFQTPAPAHVLDYRAPFFSPFKNAAGFMVPTFAFDLSFIWLMSAILFVLLCFNFFRKTLDGLMALGKYFRFRKIKTTGT